MILPLLRSSVVVWCEGGWKVVDCGEGVNEDVGSVTTTGDEVVVGDVVVVFVFVVVTDDGEDARSSDDCEVGMVICCSTYGEDCKGRKS